MRRFTRGKKEALGSEAFEDGTQVSSEEIAAAANAYGQTDALVAGTFSPAAGQADMLAQGADGPRVFIPSTPVEAWFREGSVPVP